jgi:hypothetical protein
LALYKKYLYSSRGKFIPVHLDKQIIPSGIFIYTLNVLVDIEVRVRPLLFALTMTTPSGYANDFAQTILCVTPGQSPTAGRPMLPLRP